MMKGAHVGGWRQDTLEGTLDAVDWLLSVLEILCGVARDLGLNLRMSSFIIVICKLHIQFVVASALLVVC